MTLDDVPADTCPTCGTVLQTDGCRACGWVRGDDVQAMRPDDGDELPSIER